MAISATLFENAEGAGAAAIVDGLGDVDALGVCIEAADEASGNEVADVGDHPVIAQLDRLILAEAVDALADDCCLRADAIDELAERTIQVGRGTGVAGAVDRRDERPEAVGVPLCISVGDHGVSVLRMSSVEAVSEK